MSKLFYFHADATRYCIAGEVVERIVWLPALSSLDGVPAWFAGVLNFQGKRIAVIDFSVWMGHASRQFSVKQKLLILKNDAARLAVVVDDVDGLEEWSGEVLPLEQNTEISRLLGEVRDGDEIVMLVNVAALFAASHSWPSQAISPSHLVEVSAEADAAILKARMHKMAQEVAPLALDHFLAFAVVSIGSRRYAIALEQITEFCLFKPFTYLPGCPAAIVGCMNLRGEIVAILDLGVLLGLGPSPRDAQVVVLQQAGQKISCPVQSIERLVVTAASNVIEIPDQHDQHPLSDFLLRDAGEVTPILNLSAVLAHFTPQHAALVNS